MIKEVNSVIELLTECAKNGATFTAVIRDGKSGCKYELEPFSEESEQDCWSDLNYFIEILKDFKEEDDENKINPVYDDEKSEIEGTYDLEVWSDELNIRLNRDLYIFRKLSELIEELSESVIEVKKYLKKMLTK